MPEKTRYEPNDVEQRFGHDGGVYGQIAEEVQAQNGEEGDVADSAEEDARDLRQFGSALDVKVLGLRLEGECCWPAFFDRI